MQHQSSSGWPSQPPWHQEGNTVLTPLRIRGCVAVFAPKRKQLPCARLVPWTHRSHTERTLPVGNAAPPELREAESHWPSPPEAMQLSYFLHVHEMLKLLNAPEKNWRHLRWTNWISRDRLGNVETGPHSPNQALAPRPLRWLWSSAGWINAWQRPLRRKTP